MKTINYRGLFFQSAPRLIASYSHLQACSDELAGVALSALQEIGLGQDRLIDMPPSTKRAVPVVKEDASDARYSADLAISSGKASRLSA
jgi:hypothetical protein